MLKCQKTKKLDINQPVLENQQYIQQRSVSPSSYRPSPPPPIATSRAMKGIFFCLGRYLTSSVQLSLLTNLRFGVVVLEEAMRCSILREVNATA